MKRGLFCQPGLLLGLLLFLTTGCTLSLELPNLSRESAPTEAPTAVALPTPSPDLTPEQVVRLQLEALQHNDETNQGIKIAFNFASPANRKVTGPLSNFIKMLNDPHYRPMLNHQTADFEPIKISGNTALQRVTLTAKDGRVFAYIFSLSKQTEPPYKNCWMTDGVVIEPTRDLPKGSA